VLVESQHGVRRLESNGHVTVGDVLRQAGVPLSTVWTYTVDQDGAAAFVPASTLLRDHDEVRARVNRNVDVLGLSALAPSSAHSCGEPAVTEWVFPSRGGGAYDRVHAGLSMSDCVAVVESAVRRVASAWPESLARRVVVGTSGGGDSNVMLTALVQCGEFPPGAAVPVLVDDGSDRMSEARQTASEVCREAGCELRIVRPAQAAGLAGVASLECFFSAFERWYPDADVDFAWTWLLRQVLAGVAREWGIGAVAVGANREDLLSEGLLRLACGLAPLPAPFRRIGTETWVYPMYEVPKKIGDGAFPRRSLANYEQRQASVAAGRTVFYQAAYVLADALPGFDQTLVAGFATLGSAAAAWLDPIVHDPDLGDFVVAGMADATERQRWAEFLSAVRAA
jgi:tRNA(Ile)-lysidine synthase TilS/MesJ